MNAFEKVTTERIQYFDRCEEHIKRDMENHTERIDIITESLIEELRKMQKEKKEVVQEKYEYLSAKIKEIRMTLEVYLEDLLNVRESTPKSLYETIKQFKATNLFIKTISKGIHFPEEQEVGIDI